MYAILVALLLYKDIFCHLSFVGIHDMSTDKNLPISLTKYAIPSSLFLVPGFRVLGFGVNFHGSVL